MASQPSRAPKTPVKQQQRAAYEEPDEPADDFFEDVEPDPLEEEAIGRLVEEEIQLRRYGVITREKDTVEQRTLATLWSEDERTLRFITESLKRSDEITHKMTDILKVFSSRLTTTIDSINLIRDQVTSKANELTGIRKSISEINDIIKEYDALENHGGKIRTFPKPTLKSYKEDEKTTSLNVKIFLDADEAILRASEFFLNPQNAELLESKNRAETLVAKHKRACEMLLIYFNDLLQLFSHPELLKDAIRQPLKASFIPRSACIDLNLIAARLDTLEDENNYTQIFVEERRRFLEETFYKNFGIQVEPRVVEAKEKKEKNDAPQGDQAAHSDQSHHKDHHAQHPASGSGNSTAPAQHQGGHQDPESTPDKKKDKSKRSERTFSFENICEKLLAPLADSHGYTRRSHIFHQIIDVVLLLIASESKFCADILPQDKINKTYGKVISEMLGKFAIAGKVLLGIHEHHPDRIYGTVVLLDIWEKLHENVAGGKDTYLEVFEKLLKPVRGLSKKKPIGKEISDFFTALENTIVAQFKTLLDEVLNDPPKALPADGTVHALASNTINFLVHLFEYQSTVVTLLPRVLAQTRESTPLASSSPPPLPSSPSPATPLSMSVAAPASVASASRGPPPFAAYSVKLINNLKLNLELKAKKDKSNDALSNIFKLNNFYFIWKKVGNTRLRNELSNETLEEYANWWKTEEQIYIDSWQGLKEYLEDDWKPRKKVDLLAVGKSKPNRLIKDRFSGFNQEIKELFEMQQHFFIADEELRTKMRKAIREQVLPGYKLIVEKYKDVNFSKNVDEYIKYSPNTLEDMIMNEFFEGRLKAKRKGGIANILG